MCAAVIAAVGSHVRNGYQLGAAILMSSLVYWLGHVHAHTIAAAVRNQHHPGRALRLAVEHTWTILVAPLPPLLTLLIARALSADLPTSIWAALCTVIALLGIYSFFAGRRGGLGIRWSFICALAGTGLGVLVAVLKTVVLH